MRKLMIMAGVILLTTGLQAQQETMLSQYMFNGLYINPAYAGSHEYFSSNILYRSQWVGLEGAPKTGLLAIDGPVNNETMGLGMIVANDKIGVTRETSVFGNYSYHLPLGPGKLAFGLKVGFTLYDADLDELTYWDPNDQVFAQNINNEFIPKAGFGTYYYAEKFFLGFSIPTLLAYSKDNQGRGERKFSLDIEESSFYRRHYFLAAGSVHQIHEDVKIKPSVLFKYLPEAPLEADLNLSFLLMDQFWIGGSYRTNDAFVAILEYQTGKRFRFGYSFDFTTSQLKNHSHGTHEVMIGYDFGKEVIKMKTPRYF